MWQPHMSHSIKPKSYNKWPSVSHNPKDRAYMGTSKKSVDLCALLARALRGLKNELMALLKILNLAC